MQCSIRTIADLWKREGVQCTKQATTLLTFNGKPVSYRCNEHAMPPFKNTYYKDEALPA